MKRFLVLFLLLLLCGLCGCNFLNTQPPSQEEIQAIFDRDRDALLLVTEYFISTGYTDFYVNDDCVSAHTDLKQVTIENEAVVAALRKLVNNGYQSIGKNGNTVSFCVWSKFNDTGCGLAYSVDGKEIFVEYMTQSLPLSEDGWYYYVDDFNEWRQNNS